MYELIISDVAIRQDAEGRFCLNDLHKASGENSKHKPANWLRNQQAIDLIELLNSEQSAIEIRVIFVKQGVGTFVIKELVYAYAMWINAAFHVKVIRAYDALVNGQVPDHIAKAYDELVANKIPEYLKIITAPLPVAEFEERYHFHENALEDLKNAQIIMSAREFLNIKHNRNDAKAKSLTR
jgi:hypothetical protein